MWRSQSPLPSLPQPPASLSMSTSTYPSSSTWPSSSLVSERTLWRMEGASQSPWEIDMQGSQSWSGREKGVNYTLSLQQQLSL